MVCLAGWFAVGCHTSQYWNHQRPSVEQLMVDAIEESIKHRNEQAAIVSELDTLVDEVEYVDQPTGSTKRGDGLRRLQHQQNAGSGTVEPLPAPVPTASRALTPRINEEFFETELREAISILAEEAGADVLLDERVGGVVNTTIRNATFEQALEKLLLPLGYVFGRRGEQYVVCEPNPESPLFPFVSTHIEYRPKYLNAKDLEDAPPVQLKKYVRLIEEANVLLIDAPHQFAELIVDRIRALDQPVPQVELEAIVCVVEPDSSFRFGIDWNHAVELNGETALSAGLTGLNLNSQISGQGLKELFSDFSTTSAFVQLLADNGYVSIRAAPRVIAENGKKASIKIGRETFFAFQPGGANGNSAVFFQQDIEKVVAGIELEITPYVRERDVTVQISKAEVSEDIRTSTTDIINNEFPIINRRSVSTTVHVEDGKTIIIGGLVQREVIDSLSKVPGLSRLPGVGYLFKSVDHQEREAEVVIFISPRIVRPPGCTTCPEPELINPLAPTPAPAPP